MNNIKVFTLVVLLTTCFSTLATEAPKVPKKALMGIVYSNKVYISNDKCTFPDMAKEWPLAAMMVNEEKRIFIEGCYKHDDDTIYINWQGQGTWNIPADVFLQPWSTKPEKPKKPSKQEQMPELEV